MEKEDITWAGGRDALWVAPVGCFLDQGALLQHDAPFLLVSLSACLYHASYEQPRQKLRICVRVDSLTCRGCSTSRSGGAATQDGGERAAGKHAAADASAAGEPRRKGGQ